MSFKGFDDGFSYRIVYEELFMVFDKIIKTIENQFKWFQINKLVYIIYIYILIYIYIYMKKKTNIWLGPVLVPLFPWPFRLRIVDPFGCVELTLSVAHCPNCHCWSSWIQSSCSDTCSFTSTHRGWYISPIVVKVGKPWGFPSFPTVFQLFSNFYCRFTKFTNFLEISGLCTHRGWYNSPRVVKVCKPWGFPSFPTVFQLFSNCFQTFTAGLQSFPTF